MRMSKAILIPLSQDLSDRIDNGPLRATSGRGKASWARGLILAELDRLDGYVDKTNGRKK